LRGASWFIDDRLVSGREDLFAYHAGQDEGQRLFRFRHTASELLRTRELLQRQRPSPPAVVLDMGGGTGVHAAWLAGRGYLRCSRTQLDNVVVFAWRKAVRLTTRRSVDHHHKRFGRQAGPGV
jgi:methylase of polypeptide subunit release factors